MAVNKIAPPAFEVQPPADVTPRDESMQRKASAMHEINVNDVVEFLQKVAAEKKKVEPSSMYPWRGEGYGNKMQMESAVKKIGPNEKWKVDSSRVNPDGAVGLNYAGELLEFPTKVNIRGEGYGQTGMSQRNERTFNVWPGVSDSREVPVNPAHYYYPFN